MWLHEASRGNKKILHLFLFFDRDYEKREHQHCHEWLNLRHSTLMGFWAKIPLLKFIKDNRLFKIKLHRVDVAVVYHGLTQKDAPGSRMGPDGATVTYYLK